MDLANRLERKGWSHEEVQRLVKHFELAQQTKHPAQRFAEASTFWLNLFALVVGIVAVSTFVFPFLLYLPRSLAFVVAAFLGAVYGALFGHVLHDIDELQPGHHVLFMIVAIVTALGSSLFVVHTSLSLGLAFSVPLCAYYAYAWWKHE